MLTDILNDISGQLSKGNIISINIEYGSAWVELNGITIDAGGNIEEEVNEAIRIAKRTPNENSSNGADNMLDN